MLDILALPAVIAPEAFGFPFAAHTLELLDVLGVLLPGVDHCEVVFQFSDSAFHVVQETVIEQFDEIAEHAACTTFGFVVFVLCGYAIKVLPNVTVAIGRVALGEIAFFN